MGKNPEVGKAWPRWFWGTEKRLEWLPHVSKAEKNAKVEIRDRHEVR